MMGLEPILPKKLDFESSASTNSATSAFCVGAENKLPAPFLTRTINYDLVYFVKLLRSLSLNACIPFPDAPDLLFVCRLSVVSEEGRGKGSTRPTELRSTVHIPTT